MSAYRGKADLATAPAQVRTNNHDGLILRIERRALEVDVFRILHGSLKAFLSKRLND